MKVTFENKIRQTENQEPCFVELAGDPLVVHLFQKIPAILM